ncbi:MAG: hypothetical protein RI893_466 [Pseudomonadota bacterium]
MLTSSSLIVIFLIALVYRWMEGDLTIAPFLLSGFVIFISYKSFRWAKSSTEESRKSKSNKTLENNLLKNRYKAFPKTRNKFQITVLGGRGVGKTSLLATVYGEFERHLTRGLQLQINPSTSLMRTSLSEKLGELESTLDDEIVQGISVGESDKRSYEFDVGLPLKAPDFQLVFNDYPGGWLRDEIHYKEVEIFLRNSAVILWVLDASALLVRGDKAESYSTKINQTGYITDIFKSAFKELPQDKIKKTILLVPIKCETWTTTKLDNQKLRTHIEDECGSAVNLIKNFDPEGKYFSIAIIPVQTLGGVHFDRLQTNADNQPEFVFKRKNEQAFYQPRYAEQIFSYGLASILQRYSEQSGSNKFNAAQKKLEQRRNTKEDEGFKVLHGKF